MSVNPVDRARSSIEAWIFAGAALFIVGVIVAALGLPRDSCDEFGNCSESGSPFAVLGGLVLASVATLILLIPIVAKGVWLGIAASGTPSESGEPGV